jgi:hypothetical protein
VTHHEDQAASAASRDPLLFQEKFAELAADLAPLFTRREPRAHALDCLCGLLADLPCRNCWTMAEHSGHARAFGLQRLPSQAAGGEGASLGPVRRFALRHLAVPGAVLVFD